MLSALYLFSMLVFGSTCFQAPCHIYMFRSTCLILCLMFGFAFMSLVTPLSCALALRLDVDLDLVV